MDKGNALGDLKADINAGGNLTVGKEFVVGINGLYQKNTVVREIRQDEDSKDSDGHLESLMLGWILGLHESMYYKHIAASHDHKRKEKP